MESQSIRNEAEVQGARLKVEDHWQPQSTEVLHTRRVEWDFVEERQDEPEVTQPRERWAKEKATLYVWVLKSCLRRRMDWRHAARHWDNDLARLCSIPRILVLQPVEPWRQIHLPEWGHLRRRLGYELYVWLRRFPTLKWHSLQGRLECQSAARKGPRNMVRWIRILRWLQVRKEGGRRHLHMERWVKVHWSVEFKRHQWAWCPWVERRPHVQGVVEGRKHAWVRKVRLER